MHDWRDRRVARLHYCTRIAERNLTLEKLDKFYKCGYFATCLRREAAGPYHYVMLISLRGIGCDRGAGIGDINEGNVTVIGFGREIRFQSHTCV